VVDPVTLGLWGGRGLYLGLVLAMVFLRLLPVDTEAGGLTAPDLILCLTAAWVLRRPDHVPPVMIAGVFLVCDLLFLRPPGLWTLIVLVATEFLRAREPLARELPFPLEWAMVGLVFVAAALAEVVILAVLFVPGPGVGLALGHMLITILAYPAVVGVLWLAFGLRRPAPGEVDRFGRRL
jgi:rod shape-determining protein MreD